MEPLDRDGLCEAQSKGAGGGALTLNGALVTSSVGIMDVPRHVSIYAAGDNSGRTFAVVGTDRDGAALTETITGPNATTVKGDKNFKTITSVTISGASTGDVEVGSADELESQLIPLSGKFSYAVTLSAAASLTHRFMYTLTDPFTAGFKEDDAVYFEDAGVDTTNFSGYSSGEVRACRLEITNFASGTATLNIITDVVRN